MAAVASAVLDGFDHFRSESPEALEHSGGAAKGINEMFFRWQRDNYNIMKDQGESYTSPSFLQMWTSPAYQNMRDLVNRYVDGYLANLRVEQEVQRTKDGPFFWATISYDGLYHMSHTHPDAVVSGVFYAKVPERAGAIVFDDPRGPRPPFDGKLIITPEPGELLMFPSWLVHSVLPTLGSDRRVSFSFNVQGQWSTTTDTQVHMD